MDDVYADWTPARLIPATGIRGNKEQEERSTSALLAVMAAVPSFGRAVLKPLGAPTGRMLTFIEPRFKTKDGGTAIPDAAIVVEWGKKRWVCLVEVKTGDSALRSEQIEGYVEIAATEGFDAVLTISNQIVADPNESPVKVNTSLLRKVRGGLRHLSWFRIHTEAVIEFQHRKVADPEQAWILSELIAFLDDERSGAAGLEGMGPSWVKVRDAAKQHHLKPSDSGVRDIAEAWDAFVEYLALRLYRELGSRAAPSYPKGLTRDARIDGYMDSLGNRSLLDATINIPGAAAPVYVEVDLRSRQVTTKGRISAPQIGRPTTRINWLLKQLKDAPASLNVEVHFPRTRATTEEPVNVAKADPAVLLLPGDPKKEPQAFTISLTKDMGVKNGKSRGSFVAATIEQVGIFYGSVLENVKPWTAAPPRLPKQSDLIDEEAVPDPPSETGKSVAVRYEFNDVRD